MKAAANISLLFTEVPFLDRFQAAADAGLGAVEFWWPTGQDITQIPARARAAGVDVALINFDAGDMAAGDRGLLSDPGRERIFRDNVPVALALADELGCRKLNALVGVERAGIGRDSQLGLAIDNVRYAADKGRAQGAEIMIEAVNTFENGRYLLWRTSDAAKFIERVFRDNVRLQYDAYHMQRMEGNLVATLREHIDLIGHVQIADAPGRNEPGTGEIAYRYVLEQLRELGYDDYVGLEYRPSGSTLESLQALAALPFEGIA